MFPFERCNWTSKQLDILNTWCTLARHPTASESSCHQLILNQNDAFIWLNWVRVWYAIYVFNKVWAHIFPKNHARDERLPFNSANYSVKIKLHENLLKSTFFSYSLHQRHHNTFAAVKLFGTFYVCRVCCLVAAKVIWSQVHRVDHLWKSICEWFTARVYMSGQLRQGCVKQD